MNAYPRTRKFLLGGPRFQDDAPRVYNPFTQRPCRSAAPSPHPEDGALVPDNTKTNNRGQPDLPRPRRANMKKNKTRTKPSNRPETLTLPRKLGPLSCRIRPKTDRFASCFCRCPRLRRPQGSAQLELGLFGQDSSPPVEKQTGLAAVAQTVRDARTGNNSRTLPASSTVPRRLSRSHHTSPAWPLLGAACATLDNLLLAAFARWTLPASGFLCAVRHPARLRHCAFLPLSLGQRLVRRVSVCDLTPYGFCRPTRSTPHASTGHLDRRGLCDVYTLTFRLISVFLLVFFGNLASFSFTLLSSCGVSFSVLPILFIPFKQSSTGGR